MSHEAFENGIDEVLSAIDACLKEKLITPGLLLLYAGIDIMSFLDLPKSTDTVHKRDFVKWATEYLDPKAELGCSALDLYAARCSLLHSYGAESPLTRKGCAKKILYTWGTQQPRQLQKFIDKSDILSGVSVHVGQLFNVFRAGVESFVKDVVRNPQKAELVYKRAGKFFVPLKVVK